MGLVFAGKKGIFFTLTSILLLSFLLGYLTLSFDTQNANTVVFTERVLVVNSFVDSLYEDASFALNTGVFRGFLGMTDFISTNGTYIDDIDESMNEILFNETLYGENYIVFENNTFAHWEITASSFADAFQIGANISAGNVILTQSDPWFVDATLELNVTLIDYISNASWDISRNVTTQMSIGGIFDPLYIIETNNQYVIYFEETPYETFVVGTNTSNLTAHMEGEYYVQFDGAPSFLKRFRGVSSGSGSLGIESLINKDELAAYIAVDDTLTNVDYLYFANTSVLVYDISNMPSNFKLDNESAGGSLHHDVYNVAHLAS